MQSTQPHCFSPELTARQPVASRLLASAIGGGRMSHAILLTGRALSDKWLMSRQLAAYLNCTSEQREQRGSCLLPYIHGQDDAAEGAATSGVSSGNKSQDQAFLQACQNCRWLFKDEHPKAWTVLSRDAGKSGKIPVEAARNLSEELAKNSQYLRVVIVDDASDSAFHRPAANALLKTIEEPRSNCLFILFGQCEEDVLQTIVSRCQTIPLNNLIEENIGRLAAESAGLRKSFKSGAGIIEPEWLASLRSEIFLSTAPGKKLALKDALLFAHRLIEIMDDENYEEVLDLLVNREIEQLAGIYRTNTNYSRYVQSLFKVAEEAKRQWNHYVTKKGVCESFVLSWLDLRQNLIR